MEQDTCFRRRSADVGVRLRHEVVGSDLNVSAGGQDLSEHGPPQGALLGPAAGQVVVAAQIVAHQGEGSAQVGILSVGVDIAPVGVHGEEAGGLHSLHTGGGIVADKVDELLGGVDLSLVLVVEDTEAVGAGHLQLGGAIVRGERHGEGVNWVWSAYWL